MTGMVKTFNRLLLLLCISFFLISPARAQMGGKSKPFAVADVHFEQNATDKDVEVVFEVKGGDEGLAKLTVVAPDGRTVTDFAAPDASTLGIRQYRFESPERGDVKSIKSAYPEGVYVFNAVTVSGVKYFGESALSHKLPDPATSVYPAAEAEDVSIENLEITWTSAQDLAACMVYIEQEELNVNLAVKLPGSATSFAVPNGFLLPATEYVLGIGTVTKEGNASFVETTFTTAGGE